MIRRINLFLIAIVDIVFIANFCLAQDLNNHFPEICSASSKDGLIWEHDSAVCVNKASNPCALMYEGKIYLYFVDEKHKLLQRKTAECAISKDGTNFEKQFMLIAGMPSYQAYDPCVVIDKKGMFRLYYLAEDPVFKRKNKREIHVAESTDGIFFEEIGIAFVGPYLRNPSVFFLNGKWYMYVQNRDKNNAIAAVSDDGYEFDYLANLNFRASSTPVEIYASWLRYYTFIPGPGCHIARSFISEDGLKWDLEAENRLMAKAGEEIEDVSVIRWRKGYKMFFTTGEK